MNSAQADLANARMNYDRLKKSAGGGATSQQDMDNAKAAFEVAEARSRVNQKALELAVIGPRKEDIAEARATLLADEAELACPIRTLPMPLLSALRTAWSRTVYWNPAKWHPRKGRCCP